MMLAPQHPNTKDGCPYRFELGISDEILENKLRRMITGWRFYVDLVLNLVLHMS